MWGAHLCDGEVEDTRVVEGEGDGKVVGDGEGVGKGERTCAIFGATPHRPIP